MERHQLPFYNLYPCTHGYWPPGLATGPGKQFIKIDAEPPKNTACAPWGGDFESQRKMDWVQYCTVACFLFLKQECPGLY